MIIAERFDGFQRKFQRQKNGRREDEKDRREADERSETRDTTLFVHFASAAIRYSNPHELPRRAIVEPTLAGIVIRPDGNPPSKTVNRWKGSLACYSSICKIYFVPYRARRVSSEPSGKEQGPSRGEKNGLYVYVAFL